MISWPTLTTITVIHPDAGSADAHGNTGPDWSDTTETDVAGCVVQPAATAESRIGRDAVKAAWTVLAPAGTTVAAGDRVEVDGVAYRVVGEPARWSSPTGTLAHVAFDLDLWEG